MKKHPQFKFRDKNTSTFISKIDTNRIFLIIPVLYIIMFLILNSIFK